MTKSGRQRGEGLGLPFWDAFVLKTSVDIEASTHQNAHMRTTVDIPDGLYRTLKARAGLSGVTLRQLVLRLIEQGLGSSTAQSGAGKRRDPPPVIIAPRGVPIPALSHNKLRGMEEAEDEAKHARSA